MANRNTPQSFRIARAHNRPTLSHGQKTFNSLIKQIEKRRMLLRDWETVAHTFRQRYVNEYLPLEQIVYNLQIQMVHCLDRANEKMTLTECERRKLADAITDLALPLVNENVGVKAIYNKYSSTDYDSAMLILKATLEAALGVELGDDEDFTSPEDLLQRAHEFMQQQHAEAEVQSAEREMHRGKRENSCKPLAADARAQEERAQITLSIRQIYRKLASALHPDRETDPLERERKTKLMQRVNEAYSKNNLLQLLELQLELEHVEPHLINHLGEDQLKQYNEILKVQIRELDEQIRHVQSAFRHRFRIDPLVSLSPEEPFRILDAVITEIQTSIRQLQHDLVAFDEIENVKRWLKTFKRARPEPILDVTSL